MNQLQLFESPPPALVLDPDRPLKNGPPSVQAAWQRGFSEPVKAALVARLNERVGQWLNWHDFADIRERHNIGCCMGHLLFHLMVRGRIAHKRAFYGTESPNLPGEYLGYGHLWGSIEHGPAPEHKLRKAS